MIYCCGEDKKGIFRHLFLKPYYRYLEYGVCYKCGTEHFIDERRYPDKRIVRKEYKNSAAHRQYLYWKNRLSKSFQGTPAKEHFYFGYFTKTKKGYYDTYRMNFNNKKEFLFSQSS